MAVVCFKKCKKVGENIILGAGSHLAVNEVASSPEGRYRVAGD